MRYRLALTLFLLSPFGVLVALVLLIGQSITDGPRMTAPRVGPGAGSTGGANALGEAIFRSDREEEKAREDPDRDPAGRRGAAPLPISPPASQEA